MSAPAPSGLARRALPLASCAAAASVFAAVAIVASGGGTARLRVVSIGLVSPWPALAAGVACAAIAWWLSRTVGASPRPPDHPGRRTDGGAAHGATAGCASGAVVLALATAVVAWAYGTESAAGADASGYLNAARLFAGGATSIAVPLAAEAPWPDALRTMAPLGFRPGIAPNTIVPTYAPGLPLALAAAMRVAPGAWTLVVPACAALAVLATFLLGVSVASARAALIAACGVAASPVFLFHAVQPMSDVPTTALWTLALACAVHRQPAAPFGAGLCASAAILTRPNLAPLALVLLVVSGLADSAAKAHERDPAGRRDPGVTPSRRSRLTRVAACALATLPGIVGIGWLDLKMYGHPLVSGYGATGDLFSLMSVPANAARYAGWAVDVHPLATALLAVAVAATLWRWRTGAYPRRASAEGARPLTLALACFVALNVGAYLVYAPFENWTYLRFLLPSFPLAALAASSAIDGALSRTPRGDADVTSRLSRALAIAALCGAVVGLGIRDSAARGVFQRRGIEARHELLAQAYAASASRAVFVTQQHGGAMRFHLGAPVLRWDLIDPGALDGALAWLTTRGLSPVIVLDADEEPVFRARFAGRGPWAALDWPARVETAPPQRARAFDLADRTRFGRGEAWRPVVLRPGRP